MSLLDIHQIGNQDHYMLNINLKNLVGLTEVSIAVLLEMKFISKSIKQVRVYGDAKLDSPMSFEGIYLTKGAAESVKNAGGKIK